MSEEQCKEVEWSQHIRCLSATNAQMLEYWGPNSDVIEAVSLAGTMVRSIFADSSLGHALNGTLTGTGGNAANPENLLPRWQCKVVSLRQY
jgi:hypothetical protein